MAGGGRKLARPLLLSLAAHAVIAFLAWHGPRLERPAGPDDAIEIDLLLERAPAADSEPIASPSRVSRPPEAASPRLAPGGAPGSRPGNRTGPAPSGPSQLSSTPEPPPAERNPSWLRMRSPLGSPPLLRPPPADPAPTGPARDGLGLPVIPLPDVIHHPIEKRTQGNTTTGTGLGVKVDAEGGIAFKGPAGFDLNDLAERMAGNDPYSHEKRRMAEGTFEERLCLAREAALRRQQDGLFHLKDRLEKLMQLPGLSGARRREILFEMWDECLDSARDGQPDLGAAARASILAFIRRAMPAGSAEAYTPAELTAFNQRRSSRSLFDPYRALARPDRDAGSR